MSLEKNIFLLWLQGWEKAPRLQKQVAQSWLHNNPDWTVHFIDILNLKNYVNDIDYVYDESKNMSPQAKADTIRLSLLKNHGGVWADATMLCMQPLEHWVHDAVKPAGLWMYHGHGAGMEKEVGPAIWFIVSKKESYMITKWKEECDRYWKSDFQPYTYFWLDEWFKKLFYEDEHFKTLWLKVPYIYCEEDGQSHTLAHHRMENNSPHIKELFKRQPPYALKCWNYWNDIFTTMDKEKVLNSNYYFALQMSKRKY